MDTLLASQTSVMAQLSATAERRARILVKHRSKQIHSAVPTVMETLRKMSRRWRIVSRRAVRWKKKRKTQTTRGEND